MTYETPCTSSPDDWFISRDGKQYPDLDLLTPADIAAAMERVKPAELEDELERMRADRKRSALRRRRQAKDSCYESCYLRVQCLDIALKMKVREGTWGGYYEEELRQIRFEIDKRERRRLSRETEKE